MQSITNAEKTLLAAFSPVHLHLYLGGTEIPAKLGAFSLTAAVGDREITCGNAVAATVELQVDAAPLVRILSTHDGKLLSTHDGKLLAAQLRWSGAEGMALRITWDVDGETEHGLFTGTVETAKVSAGKAKLTAHDALFWAGSGPFQAQSSYQSDADAGTVLSAIAAGMGVSLESATASLAAGVTISGGFSSCGDQITLAEAAGYVAGILGGNAAISRDGELTVRLFSPADFSTEVYSGGGQAENRDYTPEGVSFRRSYTTRTVNEDGTTSETESVRIYTAGDGRISMDNPLADQAAANRALLALAAATSRAGSYDYPMGIQVEPGDVITIRTMDGDYSAAIVSHRLDIDGGVRSSDQAGGAPSSGGAAGPLSRRIEQLEAELLRVKTLQAENAEIVSAVIKNLFAEEILCTNKFEVDNSSWSLVQNVYGFALSSKQSTEEGFMSPSSLGVGDTGAHLNGREECLISGGYDVVLEAPAIYFSVGAPRPLSDGGLPLGLQNYRWSNIYTNAVDIGGNPAVARRRKTVSGSTSSSGYISLGLGSDYVVLSVRRTDAGSICWPYWSTAANGWYAHLATTGASPSVVASTAVTLDVEYYKK